MPDARPPHGVHALIHHLIATPEDRALVKADPDTLFERFDVPNSAREILRAGGRDDLYALHIHPNLTIKWLIWSGRSTIPFFPINYYFDRR